MAFAVTVVIPCYNESRRLGKFFDFIRAHEHLPWEWLFVSDGSTDDTAAQINDFIIGLGGDSVRLVSYTPNHGKGYAVRTGFLEAKGALVGYVDVDLAASPLEFQRFVDDAELRAGQSLIIGIRVKTGDGKVQRLLHRHIMGRAFQTYTSVLSGLTVYDSQCGCKLLSRAAARMLAAQMQCDGFAFDVELLMLAHANGLHLREEMITWAEQGDSKVRLRHILQMAIDVLKITHRVRGLGRVGR